MDDLLAARSQMAMSLAFHIVFAAIGIAMPLLMIIAEWKWLRSKDERRALRRRSPLVSFVLLPLPHLQN
jgi:cytochrome bd-type quinol oxidase subunit 1